MTWLLAVLAGYLVGSINPAALIARARGVDLAGTGSGNPGATNAARAMGRGTGVLVAVLDILKGLLPVVGFGALAGPTAGLVAGFAAVIGHITSPFLRGRGGKGVATTAGAVLGAQPWWLLPMVAMFAVGVLLFRRMGLGAVFGSLALIGCGIAAPDWPLRLFGVGLGAVVLSRHTPNVRAVWQERRGG